MVVLCGGPKNSPAHPFNALILPILRGCLQPFSIKTSLSSQLFITDRSKAVILLWFSVTCFLVSNFGDVSPYACSYYF